MHTALCFDLTEVFVKHCQITITEQDKQYVEIRASPADFQNHTYDRWKLSTIDRHTLNTFNASTSTSCRNSKENTTTENNNYT